MARCRRCNRTLKAEPWKTKGIGKICAAKEARSAPKDEGDGDIILPYDGGDIWIERIACLTRTQEGMQMQKSTCSGVKTNVPRLEYRHSPTGYNFGYGGSGPSDWALNVCLLFCSDKADANRIYQEFKWSYVSVDTGDRLVIPKVEVIKFLTERKCSINNI